MKIKKNFIKLNPFAVNNLKKALKEENIAMALDTVMIIKAEKKPEIKRKTLDKIEAHLVYLISQFNLDKKSMKKHFDWLCVLVDYHTCEDYVI